VEEDDMNRNHSGIRLENSGLGGGLGLGFLVAVASVGSARTQAAGSVEPRLQIMARVYNYAVVSRGTLLGAERESSRIFREAGVEVAWLDCPTSHAEEEKCPACAAPMGAMAVDLKVVPASMAERLRSNGEEAGMALPSARPGNASAAWVFYQRVEELAESEVASSSQILGHAIAHEIGHLLLGPNAHSRTGIMRGHWDRRYLQEASQGQLLFTRDQAGRIRAEVSTRIRMQQAKALPETAARK
jgi:hypothetical protein